MNESSYIRLVSLRFFDIDVLVFCMINTHGVVQDCAFLGFHQDYCLRFSILMHDAVAGKMIERSPFEQSIKFYFCLLKLVWKVLSMQPPGCTIASPS